VGIVLDQSAPNILAFRQHVTIFTSLYLFKTTVSAIYTTCINIEKLSFLPKECVYIFNMPLSIKALISLKSIKEMVFVRKTQFDFYEQETEFLNNLEMKFICSIQSITERCERNLGTSSTYRNKKNVHINNGPETIDLRVISERVHLK
jgi:hypothetical protein